MIGDQIKKLRKSKKISQDDLSEMLGISRSTLSKIENNRQTVDRETIKNISRVLDVDYRVLVAGDLLENEVLLSGSAEQIIKSADSIMSETLRLRNIQTNYDVSKRRREMKRVKIILISICSLFFTIELIILLLLDIHNR
ncbi:MAG: helix-turn-helix domain-containing protein [Clostridiales bacterium]|nr:helix-turn-helix domain-containing protein [Clostridiales bacterium]